MIFECDTGYYHNSALLAIECQEKGVWSAEIPTCDPISCGSPLSFSGATHTSSNTNRFGDEVHYTCDYGFRGSGGVLRCTANGSWIGEIKCQKVLCSNPGNIFDSKAAGLSSFDIDSTLEFRCNEDEKNAGRINRTCVLGADGKTAHWTGNLLCGGKL